jgi:hypothetical protein
MRECKRVYEPDADVVHIAEHGFLDQVTLCGLTDWCGATVGTPTRDDITCQHCLEIVRIVRSFRDPRQKKE